MLTDSIDKRMITASLPRGAGGKHDSEPGSRIATFMSYSELSLHCLVIIFVEF